MSHFSVAVFSQTPGDAEALLAPFDGAGRCTDSPYAEFVENARSAIFDEDCGGRVATGTIPTRGGTGGRSAGGWRGLAQAACRARAVIAAPVEHGGSKGFVYPADLLRRGAGRRLRFLAAYEALIRQAPAGLGGSGREGAAPREGEEFFSPWKPEYYLASLRGQGDLHPPESRRSAPTPLSRRRARGMSQGRMGWFGLDDATNESMCQYEERIPGIPAGSTRETDWRLPLWTATSERSGRLVTEAAFGRFFHRGAAWTEG